MKKSPPMRSEAERTSTLRFTATVLLFLAAYALAQADKQVVGLLVQPIQRTFGISDTAVGLLQGVGFALAFAIGGLPLARLVDGGHRVRIAAACVATWSLATLLCGLANGFLFLFFARMLTAVAEAGLAPAFFSLLSQETDQRRILRTTSIFMLGPFIGGGLILILGGLFLRWADNADVTFGIWSSPWRMMFLAVGLPGLIVALLMLLFANEKPRIVKPQNLQPFSEVLRRIFSESALLRTYFTALLLFTIPLYAIMAWYPTLLIRDYGMSVGQSGPLAGSIYLVAGSLGTFAVSLGASRYSYSLSRMMTIYTAAALLLCIILSIAAFSPTASVSLICYGVYSFLAATILASMAVPVQLVLPQPMVGRGIAILIFVTSATSGSLGPLLVGAATDQLGVSLQIALFLISACAVMASALIFWRARRHAGIWENLQAEAAIETAYSSSGQMPSIGGNC
jgi:predicted MFS family arabinose efflux permease